jgi:(4-(4-[2-(gamma-L-glutamylamino)ethyl]phenoxymethyl)furan-2-yl)methanamine synthase
MNYLALDIGGANLKASDGRKYAASTSFPLWKMPGRLSQELRTIIAEAPDSDHLVVTMTGELADCFATRAAGVKAIVEATMAAADNRHLRFYLLDGRLVAPQIALRKPSLAAASNWHALGRFATRFAPQGTALLIDFGSTTVDIVPLVGGALSSNCQSDTQRLLAGELVYTGVERSPICAVLHRAPYREGECQVAQEFFATMRDTYIVLGDLSEVPTDNDTADGRPATRGASRARLGRCLCADTDEFNHRDAVVLATAAAEAQETLVSAAIQQVVRRLPGVPEKIIYSGHGEFVARRAVERAGLVGESLNLARKIGPLGSRCAPAYALAVLAREASGN